MADAARTITPATDIPPAASIHADPDAGARLGGLPSDGIQTAPAIELAADGDVPASLSSPACLLGTVSAGASVASLSTPSGSDGAVAMDVVSDPQDDTETEDADVPAALTRPSSTSSISEATASALMDISQSATAVSGGAASSSSAASSATVMELGRAGSLSPRNVDGGDADEDEPMPSTFQRVHSPTSFRAASGHSHGHRPRSPPPAMSLSAGDPEGATDVATSSMSSQSVLADSSTAEAGDEETEGDLGDNVVPIEQGGDCVICMDGTSEDENPIVFCSRCDQGVHQWCWGLREVPADDWYCDGCRFAMSMEEQNRPERASCVLCPNDDWPLLKITEDGEYVHPICAFFSPEAKVNLEDRVLYVRGDHGINPERWKLRCSICKIAKGVCWQCVHQKCVVPMHVICASKAGLPVRVEEILDGEDYALVMFCKKHRHSALDVKYYVRYYYGHTTETKRKAKSKAKRGDHADEEESSEEDGDQGDAGTRGTCSFLCVDRRSCLFECDFARFSHVC